MDNNKIITNLIGRLTINHSRNIILIKCLQKGIMGLGIGLKLLSVILDHVFSSPLGITKGLIIALATRLPNDCRKTVILTFQIEKLSPSNFGGALTLSTMYVKKNKVIG